LAVFRSKIHPKKHQNRLKTVGFRPKNTHFYLKKRKNPLKNTGFRPKFHHNKALSPKNNLIYTLYLFQQAQA